MVSPDSALLHGLVPVHGALGAILDVLAFLALLLTVLGLVLLVEDDPEGPARWGWAAAIVLVPILGPLAYLHARRSNGGDATQ